MGARRIRKLWPLAVAALTFVISAWLLYELDQSRDRADQSTYWAVPLAVLPMINAMFAWAWKKAKERQSIGADDGKSLNRVTDRLADVLHRQWEEEAKNRGLTVVDPIRITWSVPSQTVSGPMAAVTGVSGFDPIPGILPTEEASLVSGQVADLHALYGGLRSGRLIIVGTPGSGKTGTAVLLILDALRYRNRVSEEERALVPVPVLLTVHDWDPSRQLFVEWLVGKLQDTYHQLFSAETGKETVAELISSSRISVILDGLDEIDSNLQPVALQALSQQATFRLVVLSRTKEMAAAVSRGSLRGAVAVELNRVLPVDAANYLERTQLDPVPEGWRELIAHLREIPASPLSRALASPLALTLVCDTYLPSSSVYGLLEYVNTGVWSMPDDQAAEAIVGHLLSRVIDAAYTRRPGHPPLRYDLDTAQQCLMRVAERMQRDGIRDLNWWQIQAWSPRRLRATANTAVFALSAGLVADLMLGPVDAFMFGFLGAIIGWVVGLGGGQAPRAIGALRLKTFLKPGNLIVSLAVGLVLGLEVGLGVVFMGKQAVGFVAVLSAVILTGLIGGLGAVLMYGVQDSFEADLRSNIGLNPKNSWRRNLVYGLVSGLVFGLVFGLICGIVGLLVAGFAAVPAIGVVLLVGIVAGPMVGVLFTECYLVSLASVQLAMTWRTPVNLLAFLEDARGKGVLRAAGPSYQFRHALLQDQLAGALNHSGKPEGQSGLGRSAEGFVK